MPPTTQPPTTESATTSTTPTSTTTTPATTTTVTTPVCKADDDCPSTNPDCLCAGYTYEKDTIWATGQELDQFDSLEDAIEGCNQDSRCDLIEDIYCDGGTYRIFEGTTEPDPDYHSCVWTKD